MQLDFWLLSYSVAFFLFFFLKQSHVLFFYFQAARANLEKAQADLAGTTDEAARAEVQIGIEANEAIVKALEQTRGTTSQLL